MACWQVLCSVSVRVIAIFISWRFAPFCTGCHDCGRKSTVIFFFRWVDGWGWMGFYSELIFNENPPSNFGISLEVLFGGSNKNFQLPTSLEGFDAQGQWLTFCWCLFEGTFCQLYVTVIHFKHPSKQQPVHQTCRFFEEGISNHSINKIVVCKKPWVVPPSGQMKVKRDHKKAWYDHVVAEFWFLYKPDVHLLVV